MERLQRREPTLNGVPAYYKECISDAIEHTIIGNDYQAGRYIHADFANAGWHFATHVEGYLSEEKLMELHSIDLAENERELEEQLLQFFDREFPDCMALVPNEKRNEFIKGVFFAMDKGRFPIERTRHEWTSPGCAKNPVSEM